MRFWQIWVSDGRSEPHIVLLADPSGHGALAECHESAAQLELNVVFHFFKNQTIIWGNFIRLS